jgi:hypothetical protein
MVSKGSFIRRHHRESSLGKDQPTRCGVPSPEPNTGEGAKMMASFPNGARKSLIWLCHNKSITYSRFPGRFQTPLASLIRTYAALISRVFCVASFIISSGNPLDTSLSG